MVILLVATNLDPASICPTSTLLAMPDKSAKPLTPKSAMSSVRRTRATSKRTTAETASALIKNKKNKDEGKPTDKASEPMEVSEGESEPAKARAYKRIQYWSVAFLRPLCPRPHLGDPFTNRLHILGDSNYNGAEEKYFSEEGEQEEYAS
ncbi:hypothetical protein OIU78_009859 [Salix suchowensis]|nr:hypothetical protein OIU78_009859 [Salix suchowensis]